MAPLPSSEPQGAPDDAGLLLDLADASVVAGLAGRPVPLPALDALPAALRREVGAFVTLTIDGALNGCIGNIEGAEPLGVAVPRLAWSAAFADPRLPALRADQYERLTISISILSPLAPMAVASRAGLVAALRAGADGLVIDMPPRRAAFLPSVWEQLPDPGDFVDSLYRKAGLRVGSWPPGMTAWHFSVMSFGRKAGRGAGSGLDRGAVVIAALPLGDGSTGDPDRRSQDKLGDGGVPVVGP
jgi:AmmeMemoRadiSam system protein A